MNYYNDDGIYHIVEKNIQQNTMVKNEILKFLRSIDIPEDLRLLANDIYIDNYHHLTSKNLKEITCYCCYIASQKLNYNYDIFTISDMLGMSRGKAKKLIMKFKRFCPDIKISSYIEIDKLIRIYCEKIQFLDVIIDDIISMYYKLLSFDYHIEDETPLKLVGAIIWTYIILNSYAIDETAFSEYFSLPFNSISILHNKLLGIYISNIYNI